MRRNRRKNIYLLLFILLCSLGLGYAFLRTELTINGTAEFRDARWDIHFANLVVNPDSVELSTGNSAATISASTTEVTYAVTLKEPGDFYEFTVDAVNSGNMDAMIETISSKMGGAEITTLPNYMDYSVTYIDGATLEPNQHLKAGKKETYKVHIGFKKDINASDLTGQVENKSFSFSVTYVQADDNAIPINHNYPNLYNTIITNASMDNVPSTYVTNTNGIQYNSISSDTNGKGLYIKSDTESNTYPIYYYRGAVVDNNVVFGDFCWKIVRTTENGGIKLIYNGAPSNGKCTSTNPALPSLSSFNPTLDHPTYVGYKYGIDYQTWPNPSYDDGLTFGPDVSYADSTYSLIAKNSIPVEEKWKDANNSFNINYQHYTQYSTFDNSEVNYIYKESNGGIYGIGLNSGKKIEDAINDMFTQSNNNNDSTIKRALDTWYRNNMINYNNYIEDTIWCNDRSLYNLANSGWNPNGGNLTVELRFNGYNRLLTNSPSLSCNKNDSFTVSDSTNGNASLTYPIGLLSIDEMILAGGTFDTANSSYYLYSNKDMWSSTPATIERIGYMLANGSISIERLNQKKYVRPIISLKNDNVFNGGDGTADNPYLIYTDE